MDKNCLEKILREHEERIYGKGNVKITRVRIDGDQITYWADVKITDTSPVALVKLDKQP